MPDRDIQVLVRKKNVSATCPQPPRTENRPKSGDVDEDMVGAVAASG